MENILGVFRNNNTLMCSLPAEVVQVGERPYYGNKARWWPRRWLERVEFVSKSFSITLQFLPRKCRYPETESMT